MILGAGCQQERRPELPRDRRSSSSRCFGSRSAGRFLATMLVCCRRQRWTPSFGQVCVTAKVESGFMIHATLG